MRCHAGLQLEELGQVVDDGEADDGADVPVARPLVREGEEGVAHSQVPAKGDRRMNGISILNSPECTSY